MKKVLIIAGIVVVVIIAILIIVPIAFKPQIVRMVKEKANQNLNANLDFKDVGLSLIRSFPNASLTIDDLTVVNREPFAGDTLASLEKFQATLNLRRLIFNREAEVVSLTLDEPQILLRKLADGRVNWDIMVAQPEAPQAAPSDTAAAMDLAIKHYEINDGYLMFMDDSSNIYAELDGLDHEGNGDFKQANFTLNTRTKIDTLNLMAKGVRYLNEAELEIKADLDMDMNTKKFAFKDNEVRLNQLVLAFNGWVQMGEEATEMDVTFRAPQTEFKNILSMVPAIYKRDFADVKADGQLALEGALRGTLAEKQVPQIDIKLNVDNASIKHPDVSEQMKEISIDLQVRNPGRTVDDTEIDLRRFHAVVGGEPFDAQLLVKTPTSDPYVDGYLKGNVDLAAIGAFMAPTDSVELRGMMHSDFRFRGNVSAVERKDVQGFTASGSVDFSDIRYKTPDLPEPAEVPSARINFTPQRANLADFNLRLGKSDLRANGGLENVFGYVFGDQTLMGTLTLTSKYFDLNPFLQEEGGPLRPVELPDKIEFQMTGDFDEIVVMNMNMTDVRGTLLIKDRTLTLTDLTGKFLGGTIVSNGSYRYVKPELPHIDFKLALNKLSIPGMFRTFNTVRTFAPMAGFMKGDVGGSLNISSDLGDSLMPLWQTVLSRGALQISEARIEGFKPINAVAEALKLDRFRNPTLTNLAPSYEISEGFFRLNPVNFNIAGYPVVATGANGIDKSIDYSLKLQLPAAELKTSANAAISGLIGRDVSLLTDETVVIDVGVGGTIDNPNVNTSLNQIAKGAGEQIKQQAMQEAEQRKQELERQAQEKVEEQKSQLEDTLKQEVEQQKEEQGEKLKERLKGIFGR